MEAVTGENETAIKNDMRAVSTFDPDVLRKVTELATVIISELNEGGSMRELIGAVREYENAVFGSDGNRFGDVKSTALDLPGKGYLVGRD